MGVWRAFMKEEFKWRKHVCKRNVKGSPKTKHWSDDYPEFWPRRDGWKSKQNNVTERNRHSNAIRAAVQLCWRWCDIQQIPKLLWTKRGRLTEPLQITVIWLSTDSRYSKAADESCAYQKGILVQKKSSVIGGRRIFLTKMHYHRRQGYLPKLVTKMNEIPTTFESSVVK